MQCPRDFTTYDRVLVRAADNQIFRKNPIPSVLPLPIKLGPGFPILALMSLLVYLTREADPARILIAITEI